jgi:hypothetical protein
MKFSEIKRPVILYPYLLIVLFVLSRLRIPEVNPGWSDILKFLVINLVVLLLTFGILNYFLKDRLKAWLVDFLFFLYILYYFKVKEPLLNVEFINKVLAHFTSKVSLLLIVSLFVVLIGICILVIRYKGSLARISRYINLLVGLLIVYQLFAIVTQSTGNIKLKSETGIFNEKRNNNTDSLPDIYYIILDAYTSNQSLKDYWNFNNDSLANFLTDKGFYIAKNSKTNYNFTLFSLASSLNASYLENVPRGNVSAAQAKNLFDIVNNSSVVNFLKKSNYRIINYSFFNIPETPKYYNDFFFLVRRNLLRGTIYLLLKEELNKNWVKSQNQGLFSLKTINLDILNKLTQRDVDSRNPKFVYAHVMMPHDPYLFDEHGRVQESDSVLIPSFKERYLKQLKYTNKLIENTINKILENHSGKLPVIIIQGDHGYRYLKGKNRQKESMTILNAYFFPDRDYKKIYTSITPVNTFRVLLDKYMDAGLPLLKDASYNIF